jgi:hypothetical protein
MSGIWVGWESQVDRIHFEGIVYTSDDRETLMVVTAHQWVVLDFAIG